MKKKIRRIIVILLILVVAILIAIFGYNKLQDSNEQEQETIVKKNVKVITSETDKKKQPVSVTEDSIIFNSRPEYREGDVIVSGITSTSKNGFIRKVIGIEKNGDSYVVKTEPAVLTDVFEKAQIYKRIKLTEDGNKSASYSIGKTENTYNDVQNVISQADNTYRTVMLADKKEADDEDNGTDYVFGKKFEMESDPFTISGEAGFDVWLDIKIEIKHGNIICGMAIKSKEGGKILLKCGKDWNKEEEWGLWEKSLPNYEFVVAGIPIVVTNKLELNAEAGAELEGNIGLSYELASETTTGFEFKSKTGKVKEIKEIDYDSDGLQWETISVSGEASAKIAIHYISKLYGCSGIDVSAGISGKAEGEANQTANTDLEGGYAGSLDLSINPEIQGELIVDIPVFAEDLKKQPLFEAKMKPLWSKHWESSVKWKDDLEWTETGKQDNKGKLKRAYRCAVNNLTNTYSANIIYKKYQTVEACASIYDYLESGRCYMLEGPYGAYNKYDDDLAKGIIIKKLEEIGSKMDMIIANQEKAYCVMQKIQKNVEEMESDMKNICQSLQDVDGKLNDIANNTKITAWASSVIATQVPDWKREAQDRANKTYI